MDTFYKFDNIAATVVDSKRLTSICVMIECFHVARVLDFTSIFVMITSALLDSSLVKYHESEK